MDRYELFRARSLTEAVDLLNQYGNDARPIAAGTDLLVQMRAGKAKVKYLVSIRHLADLKYITEEEGMIRIGPLTTHDEVSNAPIVKECFPALAEASGLVGSRQTRNIGTLGGNLCNAAPSAETAPALLVAEAVVKICSPSGERTLPLREFFVGPGKTALKPGELLTEVAFRKQEPGCGSAYLRISTRRAMDIAMVGVAALVSIDNSGKCKLARIALGAVSPVPMRAEEAEAYLVGITLSKEAIDKAAEISAQAAQPITDVRASAEYRREMVRVLTSRALLTALNRAQNCKNTSRGEQQ